MEDLEFSLKMLSGSNIDLGGLIIKNYTLKEILNDIGVYKYYSITKMANATKRKWLGEDCEIGLLTALMSDKDICKRLEVFLDVFVLHDEINVNEELGIISVVCNGNRFNITDNNLEVIFDVVKHMYCVSSSEEVSDVVDDEFAELLREFAEEEAKVRQANGTEITLDSIIESVSVSHPSLNLNTLFSYTMYQLIHTYKRIDHIKSSDSIKTGVYSGSISSKDIKLEQLNWARKLDG